MKTYILTGSSVTMLNSGEVRTVGADHFNFSEIKKLLGSKSDKDFLRAFKLASITQQITGYNKNITVKDNRVYYNGEEIHNVVTTKILGFMKEGLDVTPLINFLNRLMNNPSKNSVDQLYTFLEKANLPIDEEGYIYGYKAVRSNYMDKYSGKFDNRPGQILSMERNKVADDPHNGCSYGFHFGSQKYVDSFASPGDKKVVVKVDPADVVSVPHDCDHGKCRVSAYEVVSDLVVSKLPTTLYKR